MQINKRLGAKVSDFPHRFFFLQEFINRTATMHGHIDLEWLRYAPPNDVK